MNYFFKNLSKQLRVKVLVFLISMRRLSIFLFAGSFAPAAYSDNFAAKPLVIMNGSNNLNRVCLYEDKTYSLGAVILVGNVYLDCVPEKKIETDGRLMWERIQSENQN